MQKRKSGKCRRGTGEGQEGGKGRRTHACMWSCPGWLRNGCRCQRATNTEGFQCWDEDRSGLGRQGYAVKVRLNGVVSRGPSTVQASHLLHLMDSKETRPTVQAQAPLVVVSMMSALVGMMFPFSGLQPNQPLINIDYLQAFFALAFAYEVASSAFRRFRAYSSHRHTNDVNAITLPHSPIYTVLYNTIQYNTIQYNTCNPRELKMYAWCRCRSTASGWSFQSQCHPHPRPRPSSIPFCLTVSRQSPLLSLAIDPSTLPFSTVG